MQARDRHWATEAGATVHAFNRMLALERPIPVRIA